MTKWLVGTFAVLLVSCVGYAHTKSCPASLERQALDEPETFQSWKQLHSSYLKFRNCDDGAIAEGYSESVVRLLADHWAELHELARVAESDPGFRKFVLKHIDATVNPDDLEKINKQAGAKCPTGLQALCGDLASKATAALTKYSSAVRK